MSKVRQSCRKSFALLYDATAPEILAFIRRINSDIAEAEDVLQDVYVHVWVHRLQFDESRGNLSKWLYRIARNAALDSLRRRRTRPRTVSAFDDDGDPFARHASHDSGPLEAAAESGTREVVRQCLQRLEARHRQALVLAFWSGLTHEEIAASLGHPLGTVKSWMRRSMASMRPMLSVTGLGAPVPDGHVAVADN